MFTYQLCPATHSIMPGHRCCSPMGSWIISSVEFKRDEYIGHLTSPNQVVLTCCHEPESQAGAMIHWCSRTNFGISFLDWEWVGLNMSRLGVVSWKDQHSNIFSEDIPHGHPHLASHHMMRRLNPETSYTWQCDQQFDIAKPTCDNRGDHMICLVGIVWSHTSSICLIIK